MTPERLSEIFEHVAGLIRWVPWRMVWNPTANKGEGAWDKIPHNGRFGLSTTKPDNWATLEQAGQTKVAQGLTGIGLVMTGGIEHAGWRLLGFDFDKVTEDFELPFDTYAETSPSGKGVRAFVWVPATWAADYKDTGDAKFAGCDHCELYLGTAPRFLTVTFNAFCEQPFARLEGADLKLLASKLRHKRDIVEQVGFMDDEGEPIDLTKLQWSGEQAALIEGKPGIDRSSVIHGVIVRLVNAGASQADIFATMLRTKPLWQYCLDHRHDDPERAAQFAREEVMRAFNRTAAGAQQRVLAQWQQAKPKPAPTKEQLQDDNASPPESVWGGPEKARRPGLFEVQIEPREFIIDKVLPVSNGVLIGPGGTGKSALTLWEGANIILGRDVWNRKVLRPGAVLFLTAEDRAEDLDYRMQQIAASMSLSPAEKKRLTENYFVEDVFGKMVRFVEKDMYGNLTFTDHIESLIQKYEKEGIVLINVDPHNLFGPGESLLNDGEAAMAAAANAISYALNCHVRYLKHTGQNVAREKIRDQYTGRGGSAGADNMRQVMQLTSGIYKDAPLPKKADLMANLLGNCQTLTVDFHKVSYGPPQFDDPTLIVRTGWQFFQFEKEEPGVEGELVGDMQIVCAFVRNEIRSGRFPTKRTVEDVRPDGITQARARTAISGALQKGWLVLDEMPREYVVGNNKSYLRNNDDDKD